MTPRTSTYRLRSIHESLVQDVGLAGFVGRSDRKGQLRDEMKKLPCTCLYLYGPPGTGKTSLTTIIGRQIGLEAKLINCSAFASQSLESAMGMIIQSAVVDPKQCSLDQKEIKQLCSKKGSAGISELFTRLAKGMDGGDSACLVFDELESLTSINIPGISSPLSHLIIKIGCTNPNLRIIGIGNDLNFINSINKAFLPQKTRSQLVPIEFAAYTLEHVMEIIDAKLSVEDYDALESVGLSKKKMELAVRKAFTQYSGDCRRILTALAEMVNKLHTPEECNDEQRWKAAFDAIKSVSGGKESIATLISGLPWTSQVLLIALVKDYANNRTELTISDACRAYTSFCDSLKLSADLNSNEMIMRAMEALSLEGLLSIQRKNPNVSARITSLGAPKKRSFKNPKATSMYKSPMKRIGPSIASRPTSAMTSPHRAFDRVVMATPTLLPSDFAYITEHIDGITQRLIDRITF